MQASSFSSLISSVFRNVWPRSLAEQKDFLVKTTVRSFLAFITVYCYVFSCCIWISYLCALDSGSSNLCPAFNSYFIHCLLPPNRGGHNHSLSEFSVCGLKMLEICIISRLGLNLLYHPVMFSGRMTNDGASSSSSQNAAALSAAAQNDPPPVIQIPGTFTVF